MAMPPATLCTSTFSTGLKGNRRYGFSSLKTANPMRLEGIDMMETQPVCRPKYMLAAHITVPTARPAATPRTVKLRPCGDGDVILTGPLTMCASGPGDPLLDDFDQSAATLVNSR
ncbi:hypothetical protein CCMA1212_002367 [Trichoderma ghanense]|uniref:Uncharacterized protein n=1 Tax=Trichoderma ghanense TaxID=65468 RepID=A0ABY2HE61_9HYPO